MANGGVTHSPAEVFVAVRIIGDQGDIRIARCFRARRCGEPDVRITRALGVVRHKADVGIAGQLARVFHADDHRARARDRVRWQRQVIQEDVLIGRMRSRRPVRVTVFGCGISEGRLGRAHLELRQIQIVARTRRSRGDVEIREVEFGVGSEPTATCKFIHVGHPESPCPAIEKGAHLAVLRLGLQLFGTHP